MVAGTNANQPNPSPREIRDACEQIRARWSKNMREKRRVRQQDHWTPPQVRCDLYWSEEGEAHGVISELN